jgi:hypothetical protein
MPFLSSLDDAIHADERTDNKLKAAYLVLPWWLGKCGTAKKISHHDHNLVLLA